MLANGKSKKRGHLLIDTKYNLFDLAIICKLHNRWHQVYGQQFSHLVDAYAINFTRGMNKHEMLKQQLS